MGIRLAPRVATVILSLAVTVALAGCALCHEQFQTHAIGQWTNLAPSTLVVSIDKVKVRHTCAREDPLEGVQKDAKLAYVWVTLKNKGRHSLHAPYGLSMRLSHIGKPATRFNNFASASTPFLRSCAGQHGLYMGCYFQRAIGPGRKCGGWVVFEVPRGLDVKHQSVEISYCDDVLTQCRSLGVWTLSSKGAT